MSQDPDIAIDDPEIPIDDDPLGGALDAVAQDQTLVDFAGKTCEETTGMVGDQYLRCGAPAVMLVKHRGRAEGPYFMCLACGTHNTRNRNAVALTAVEVAAGAENSSADVPPAVSSVPAPVAAPLAELLPADFPLPLLIKFVPDTQLKADLDAAVRYANGLQIANGGQAAIDTGDAAVTAVKKAVQVIELHFEEPTSIAYRLHKQLTEARGRWIADGVATAKLVGRRVADETLRLEEAARKERARVQAEEDRKTREAAERVAEEAKSAGAPEEVVEQLKEQAVAAVAPPVAMPPPSAPRTNTVTQTWKARIKGTPADAEANPAVTAITPVQRAQVIALLAAIVKGEESISLIELNWSAINARAKAEKGAFNITGMEAFPETGLRAKPGGRR